MYAFLFEDGNAKRGVAQLVARSVRDAEVVGSIPVASTKTRHLCRISLHKAVFFLHI